MGLWVIFMTSLVMGFSGAIMPGPLLTVTGNGKRLFTPMVYRIVLGVCGLFLVGLASYFVYSGTSFLLFKS